MGQAPAKGILTHPRRDTSWPNNRTVCFCSGAAVLMAAVGSCKPYFGPHTLAQRLLPKTRWSFRMRAMFVACCLGLLVGVVASPVHARAFCKSKDCQRTSARNAAPKHAATSLQRSLVNTQLRLSISWLLNRPRPPMLQSTLRRRPLRSAPLCTAPSGPFTLPRPSLNHVRRAPRAKSALLRSMR